MNMQQSGIIAWFVQNPVAANLLMWFIIVSGLLSISDIRRELVPAKHKPALTIKVAYPGASPLEVEEGITLKIEEAVKHVRGIKKVDARSRFGSSSVHLTLEDGYDPTELSAKIKIAIDGIRTFPSQAEEVLIKQTQYSALAIQLQLHGQMSEREAKLLAHQIKEELLAETNVKKAEVWGDRPFEITIEVDEQKLRKYQLTMNDVATKIRLGSVNLPSGGINSSRGFIVLRIDEQSYRQADFENLVLRTQEDGVVIRLSDVASVKDEFISYSAKAYFDGEYSVGIALFAVGNQDISKVAEEAKAFAKAKTAKLPEGISLSAWGDITYYLNGSQSMMLDNMLIGALLVAFILAFFLKLRVVFWVIVGLPVCFLGTLFFLPMSFVDVSINIISIFGFILVLGIIVDDAIIIGESVDTEIEAQGYSQQAVISGVKRVFLPAFFGVLTTVVAFLPMIMIEGPWKAAPHAVGFIVIFCLLFSLLESKLILPAHLAASHQGFFSRFNATWHEKLQQYNNGKLQSFVDRYYLPLLHRALHQRYIVIALFIALLLITFGLIGGKVVNYVLLPSNPSDFLKVSIQQAKGTDRAIAEANVNKITEAIYQVEESYQAQYSSSKKIIQHVFRFNKGATSSDFTLELTKPSDRPSLDITSFDIIKRWREAVGDIPEATQLNFSAVTESDKTSHKLYYMLVSQDSEALRLASEELTLYLKTFEGLSNIHNSAKGVQESYTLKLKPRAEALGLTPAEISKQVHNAFYGIEAQRILRDNTEIKVMVKRPTELRKTLTDLYQLDIRVAGNRFIPLSELVYLEESALQTSLTRINYQSAAVIKAQLDKSVLSPNDVNKAIKDYLTEMLERYPNVNYDPKGEGQGAKDLEYDLAKFFLLAFLGVFALLAIPLKSYFQPLIIMSAVPFGVVGAVFGHWVLGTPISMMSLFGMIALTGVVVNDSLIMVDFINKAKLEGLSTFEAAIQSGKKRFRAIFLTTATTFVGVIPMLLETDPRAENIIAMAISLGFGILFATAITLLLVPCCYLILDDIKNVFKKPNTAIAAN